jgi:hypothetical protein
LMLSEAEQWFLANRLTLHPAKTRYMLFSHCKTNLTLQLMGHDILRIQESGPEKSFKLVGVHLDKQMNWKEAPCHSCQTKNGGSNVTCL